MAGVKRHYIIGQFLHENGSIKTEILVFLDLFPQFFNMLLWPDPVSFRLPFRRDTATSPPRTAGVRISTIMIALSGVIFHWVDRSGRPGG